MAAPLPSPWHGRRLRLRSADEQNVNLDTQDPSRHAVSAAGANDDFALVLRAQQRDTYAFELLYRRHVGRIYALCLRLTTDVHRAEELTQTAFVQAWQKLALFRAQVRLRHGCIASPSTPCSVKSGRRSAGLRG